MDPRLSGIAYVVTGDLTPSAQIGDDCSSTCYVGMEELLSSSICSFAHAFGLQLLLSVILNARTRKEASSPRVMDLLGQ